MMLRQRGRCRRFLMRADAEADAAMTRCRARRFSPRCATTLCRCASRRRYAERRHEALPPMRAAREAERAMIRRCAGETR